MMLIQKLFQRKHILNLNLHNLLKKYSKQATASEFANHEKTFFASPRNKEPPRESILKSLLTGQVDDSIFAYPEVLSSERYKDFFNWLKPIENYILSCAETNEKLNKEEILHHLRELEVFRAHMEENYGLNLLETESLKLIETVSTLPWLSTYLVKNNILPVKIISKYGSTSQKEEYYSKIISGDIVPTICIKEGDYGTNINNIKTHAILNEGDSWLLNGDKTFVVNGISSNLFLVFARTMSKSSHKFEPDSFSLFLVEKDHKTVICNEVCETIGKHEVPICTIKFKDTVVPNKNIIGEPGAAFNILTELLKPGEQNIAAQAISILRNFTNQLIIDILKTKHFDRDLYQYDCVKHTLGEIIFTLYSMESMAYLTSGLIDLYENQDVTIEKIITEQYCANKCISCIQTGLQLMGAQSYINNTSYIQALHDALALTTLDMNNMDANTYVGAAIIQHIGKTLHEHVYKKRNAAKFPFYNMMDSMFNKAEVKMSIPNYLHPSLKIGAEHLEESVNILRRSFNTLLIQSGSQILEQYSNLEKVTEMLTEIYAGFANLSRSSRSYSLGIRNADTEKAIGVTMAFIAYHKVNAIAQKIENGIFPTVGSFYTTTSEQAYENHRYCMEHPITRIIF